MRSGGCCRKIACVYDRAAREDLNRRENNHDAKDRDSGRNGSRRLRARVSNGEGWGTRPDRLAGGGTCAGDGEAFARTHWRRGAATRVLGVWQGSAAEQTKELLPAGVSLAAAFQNLGAEVLAGDASVDCDVLVCSDDEKAKQVAFELVGKIPGARALNGGKLENARIVESLTALLIGLNMRYKVHGAGIRFTGLPLK